MDASLVRIRVSVFGLDCAGGNLLGYRTLHLLDLDFYVAVPNPTGVLMAFGKIRYGHCVERPQVRKSLAS